MFKDTELCYIGLLIFVMGLIAFGDVLFNKNENKKPIIFGVACILLSGVSFLAAFLGNFALFIFAVALAMGGGFAAIGISNIILYKTCTTKITATYLYSRITGKRGNSAVPVFRYTFEGEEYTCASKQQVSSSLIGTKYRIDQPCQIFINPTKPKNNIVRFGKMRDEIGKIVIGIGFIVGGVCALLFM